MQEMELIKKLIGQARHEKAIDVLLGLKTEYHDLVVGLESRLNTLEKREMAGIISYQEAGLERRQIVNGLLNITSKLESKDVDPPINISDKSGFEKIIGRNGLTRISWLTEGLEKAKSVCKIHTADGYVGTGFLVADGYIFTNNHVIGSASIAQFSRVEFGYDAPDKTSVFYNLDHTDFVTSVGLDYTKVKVKDTHPKVKLEHWGALELSYTLPNNNDALVIIQHPQGRRKELAFSDGGNSSWEHRLHYKVTTEPGSSGSPVFDINWKVIALHHAGGKLPVNTQGDVKYVNEGTLFSYIKEDIDKHGTKDKGTAQETSKPEASKPVKSLLIYNSKDAEYGEGLFGQLFTQIRVGNLEIFDIQNDIPPNEDRKTALKQALEDANMVLVMISRKLYSGNTLQIALDVEKQVKSKRVIPIRVSPFNLDGTVFASLQGLPSDGKSISDYEDLDNALYEIAESVSRVIKQMIA